MINSFEILNSSFITECDHARKHTFLDFATKIINLIFKIKLLHHIYDIIVIGQFSSVSSVVLEAMDGENAISSWLRI